jgi:hypothetical protein
VVTFEDKAEIGTIAGGAAANVFTFNKDGSTVGTFTSGNAGTVIAGNGEVTITAALTDTSTNTVIIKNTKGVILTATNTIAANIKVTKAKIVGSTAGGGGVTIQSTATDIEVHDDESITVSGDGTIVAGASTNIITITKAVLGPGKYTGAAAALTLSGNAVITVKDGGTVNIAGTAVLKLTAGGDKVVLKEGGTLAVAAGAAIDDVAGSYTAARFGVYEASDTGFTTAKKTLVAGTVVTTTDGTGADSDIILGLIKFTLANSEAERDGEAAGGSAAAGSVKAGAATVVVFTGST